ncbi:MAG: hypothetical protein BAA02_09710 [Paenibacillaceae bacterium ZCTH02-B3]|nr:MAG: hypothetical protein BAA02_09710 [Paenibacillaceae bacterium ZCTH02-B3]
MHALAIGGSGMLSGASLWLAEQGYRVSVIGRNPQKLRRLSERNANLFGVSADYAQAAEFAAALQDLMKSRGPASLVVAWVHFDENRRRRQVSVENGAAGSPSRLHRFASAGWFAQA